MQAGTGNVFEEDRRVPPLGEASLLLDELRHRVSNEVSAALAALRLAQAAGISGPRLSLFEQAVDRLEGFGQVHTILATPPARVVDLNQELHRLCRGLVTGRVGMDDARVRLTVKTLVLPGGVARRLVLIAAELIFNAMRHALVGRAGKLDITVQDDGSAVTLTVADDGPGMRSGGSTSGTGLGSGIVAALVRMGRGRIECDTDRHGTTFRVSLPISDASTVTWSGRGSEL